MDLSFARPLYLVLLPSTQRWVAINDLHDLAAVDAQATPAEIFLLLPVNQPNLRQRTPGRLASAEGSLCLLPGLLEDVQVDEAINLPYGPVA